MTERGLEITVTFEEQQHVYRHNELTAIDVRDCRKETGFTPNRLIGLLGDTDPDIDSLAALLWLARRQNGERGLRYDAVASQIRQSSVITVDVFMPEMLSAEERAAEGTEPPE